MVFSSAGRRLCLGESSGLLFAPPYPCHSQRRSAKDAKCHLHSEGFITLWTVTESVARDLLTSQAVQIPAIKLTWALAVFWQIQCLGALLVLSGAKYPDLTTRASLLLLNRPKELPTLELGSATSSVHYCPSSSYILLHRLCKSFFQV